MKMLSANERVFVKRYVDVEVNGTHYTVYICNNEVNGIYEHVEVRVNGRVISTTVNVGKGIKRIFGISHKEFHKRTQELLNDMEEFDFDDYETGEISHCDTNSQMNSYTSTFGGGCNPEWGKYTGFGGFPS